MAIKFGDWQLDWKTQTCAPCKGVGMRRARGRHDRNRFISLGLRTQGDACPDCQGEGEVMVRRKPFPRPGRFL
jgi:DnaJ-class molecular chaperone